MQILTEVECEAVPDLELQKIKFINVIIRVPEVYVWDENIHKQRQTNFFYHIFSFHGLHLYFVESHFVSSFLKYLFVWFNFLWNYFFQNNMASGILKLATRRPSLMVSNEALARMSAASFHTSSKNQSDTWEIPERLHHIPTAESPSFFNMVEYYFHKACVVAEPSLFDMLQR